MQRDPRDLGKALTGTFSGKWSYRIGDYRLICEFLNDRWVVAVLAAQHRGDVYH